MAAYVFTLALVALFAFQVNGQLSLSFGSDSDSALGSIGQFGRNTAARMAASKAANIATGASIGGNAITTMQDSMNAGLGVSSGIARTANSFGADRLVSLTNSGSQLLDMKRNAMTTGIRIGQDATRTGLDLASRGVNAGVNVLQRLLDMGGRLAGRGLNATARLSDRAANLGVNLANAKTGLMQRGLSSAGNIAYSAGSAVDSVLGRGSALAENLVNAGASGARSALNGLARTSVDALGSFADVMPNSGARGSLNVNLRG